MRVLWGGAAGQGPVGEVPTGHEGSGVMIWTCPPEDNKQAGEMLGSGAALATARGQGLLIKWLFPTIPQWPVDSAMDREMHEEIYI